MTDVQRAVPRKLEDCFVLALVLRHTVILSVLATPQPADGLSQLGRCQDKGKPR